MSKAKPHTTLSAKNISIGYKDKVVVQHINFEVYPSELVAIVGINGVGKSTLLRTLANLQRPLAGEILLKSKSLEHYNTTALASEISVVLTEPSASKNLTVYELIALGRQPYTNWIGSLSEEDEAKITEVITTLQLEELKHQKCFVLSDGQLQRVMIARALAQDTDIILLDEPTTHLDIYHKVQILKLLKNIARETGKTIVFTSHEIEMSLQLCDQMLLLKPTASPFGKPKELIAKGSFNDLFPRDTVSFDTQTETFRIIK